MKIHAVLICIVTTKHTIFKVHFPEVQKSPFVLSERGRYIMFPFAMLHGIGGISVVVKLTIDYQKANPHEE